MRWVSVCALLLLAGCTPTGSSASAGSRATTGSSTAPTRPSAPAPREASPSPERDAKTTSPISAETTQLLTVVSRDWSSVPATLRRYERSKAWVPVGRAIPVVLGKSGLGWGRGLPIAPAEAGPAKREGDGRSPAGVFTLGTAFGYAAADRADWISMPYAQATDDLECVDDPSSSHYNQLVHRSAVGHVDWASSEHMRRKDDRYRWGLFVDHNTSPVVAGSGSCIFLHLWRGPESSTVGCTAGEETQMKEVFAWLKPSHHPILVQLPRAVYDAHARDWALPARTPTE